MSSGGSVGPPVDPRPARWPERQPIEGRYVTLAPIEASHAPALYEQLCGAGLSPEVRSAVWRYLPGVKEGFETQAEFTEHIAQLPESRDPFYYTVLLPKASADEKADDDGTKPGTPVGYLAYLNIEPGHRSVEIGWVTFSPALQRTRAATEALALAIEHAVQNLGFRRVEWKCDALNTRSRRAAERLGFAPEGLFRAHRIVRGRNRDTAWYAIVDDEDWVRGRVGAALKAWLRPDNFRADGSQVKKLEEIREQLRRDGGDRGV